MKLEELLNILPAHAYVQVEDACSEDLYVECELIANFARNFPKLRDWSVVGIHYENPGIGFARYVIQIKE